MVKQAATFQTGLKIVNSFDTLMGQLPAKTSFGVTKEKKILRAFLHGMSQIMLSLY